MLTVLLVVLAIAGIAAYVHLKKSGGLAELFDAPPDVHPVLGVGTTTAPPKLPAGIIGAPNSDRLVQVQAVEDYRAKYGAAGMDTDAEPNNNWWARHLPHWWAIDEVARCFDPLSDVAAAYVISQCNHKMLIGALNRNNSNEWVPWVNRPGSTETYASPLDAGVVAGPNPLASGLGFPGIKIADLPALLEANRKIVNSGGKRSDDDIRVAGPIHGGGTGPRSRG